LGVDHRSEDDEASGDGRRTQGAAAVGEKDASVPLTKGAQARIFAFRRKARLVPRGEKPL